MENFFFRCHPKIVYGKQKVLRCRDLGDEKNRNKQMKKTSKERLSPTKEKREKQTLGKKERREGRKGEKAKLSYVFKR